jgi:hypothetical protein
MFSEEEKRQMAELIDKTPDITLREIRAHFGKTCSLPAIFNPIEKMWSKLKKLLRGMKARTNEDLFLAVQTALEQVSKNDARGRFQSCGYALYKN